MIYVLKEGRNSAKESALSTQPTASVPETKPGLASLLLLKRHHFGKLPCTRGPSNQSFTGLKGRLAEIFHANISFVHSLRDFALYASARCNRGTGANRSTESTPFRKCTDDMWEIFLQLRNPSLKST